MLSSPNSQFRPVYEDYFADPFVWKCDELYYAVGTGADEAEGRTAGKVFPLLRSPDLLSWECVGGALIRPEPGLGNTFWAPAVASHGGTFYLYYSVGHEDRHHQLRVARSSQPQGPYEDLGRPLLDPERTPFAIDPHPFQDDDGAWYLFFARDFLDHSDEARAGTALIVCRMRSMTELEGSEEVVLRARSGWQRFQRGRHMYGRTWDWHTLEGPCAVKHAGRYYCFYSGGCWENETYGVDYGLADQAMGPYSDLGNESGPRVLRTVPNRLIGPGHNSLIVGPDGNDYLVFHAWDTNRRKRQMHIRKLDWTRHGPRCG